MRKQNEAVGYCRLSKDDDIRSGESSSISTQKEIIEKYASDNGWQIKEWYIDDGYSGTNFKRPDFQRLIDDIEEGRISLLLSKDLSRLGRDYLKTGYYTEVYFPENNVRYIAINDNIDTLNSDNDIAPFKNILNEFYSRDLSKKVKSAVRAKKQKGEFLSAFVPLGYQRDPKNKNKLIIEETGVKIVNRIFEMARAGMGSCKICNALNAEKVPTRSDHRRMLFGLESKSAIWDANLVNGVLKNRVYLGETVQGTYDCAKFKRIPTKRKPEEEWIITPNTHEPLIDIDTWELVQNKINSRHRPIKSNVFQLFAGFVKCADCGYSLGYSNSHGSEYYSCSLHRRRGNGFCTSHYIRKDVLEQVVLYDIRKYSKLAKDKAEELAKLLCIQTDNANINKIKHFTAELSKQKNRYSELDGILKRLYEDFVIGTLSKDRFDKFFTDYESEQLTLQEKITETTQELEVLKTKQQDTTAWINLIRNYTQIEKLDRTVLSELVEKIVVSQSVKEDGKKVTDIAIHYRFIGVLN